MRIFLHKKANSDIAEIVEHYEDVGGPGLADDFFLELTSAIYLAAERPGSFGIREKDLRRVNLDRFPYHFLFRVVNEEMEVLVVRHHARHPSFGTSRK